jgi:hypothetical protein
LGIRLSWIEFFLGFVSEKERKKKWKRTLYFIASNKKNSASTTVWLSIIEVCTMLQKYGFVISFRTKQPY